MYQEKTSPLPTPPPPPSCVHSIGQKITLCEYGDVRLAQLVERRTFNPVVEGSIPSSDIFFHAILMEGEWYHVDEATQWTVCAVMFSLVYLSSVAMKLVATDSERTNKWLWLVPMKKKSDRARTILHLCVCLPFRAAFVAMIFLLPRVGLTTLFRSTGFIPFIQSAFWAFQSIKNTTTVGQFGGQAWWAPQRKFHAILFLVAGLMTIKAPFFAFIPYAVDAWFSCVVVVIHYCSGIEIVV